MHHRYAGASRPVKKQNVPKKAAATKPKPAAVPAAKTGPFGSSLFGCDSWCAPCLSCFGCVSDFLSSTACLLCSDDDDDDDERFGASGSDSDNEKQPVAAVNGKASARKKSMFDSDSEDEEGLFNTHEDEDAEETVVLASEASVEPGCVTYFTYCSRKRVFLENDSMDAWVTNLRFAIGILSLRLLWAEVQRKSRNGTLFCLGSAATMTMMMILTT